MVLSRTVKRGRRTLIWPLLSTGAPRTAGRFFCFRGVITGPRLTALLLATPRASRTGVSAKLHQTLIQGSATASFSKRRRLRVGYPRPRNSCVPPAGPSRRWAHARGRSQFSTGSAGGQPRGERSTSSSASQKSRAPCRGPIQATGSGSMAQRCLRARSSHTNGSGVTRSPGAGPSSAASSPTRAGGLRGVVRAGRRVFEGPARTTPSRYEAKNRLTSNACPLRSRW